MLEYVCSFKGIKGDGKDFHFMMSLSNWHKKSRKIEGRNFCCGQIYNEPYIVHGRLQLSERGDKESHEGNRNNDKNS